MKKTCIFLLLISIGCSDKQADLKYLICKDSVQYWNYEWPRERASHYGFTFRFDDKGSLVKYSLNKETNIRRKFWDIQDPALNRWDVTKDSILKIMDTEEKIIKLTEDTIHAVNLKTKEKVFYIRVKGKLNIVE